MDVFSLFIIICGAYVTYAAIALKTKGEINTNLMVTKSSDPMNIRDLEGFKSYMFPRTLALGILAALSGLWGVIGGDITGSVIPEFILIIVMIGFIAYYLHCIKVAEKKFW